MAELQKCGMHGGEGLSTKLLHLAEPSVTSRDLKSKRKRELSCSKPSGEFSIEKMAVAVIYYRYFTWTFTVHLYTSNGLHHSISQISNWSANH